jgi:hypothetical protein
VWVWHWNWSCDGVEPPPVELGSATVCVACNLAVSIRVGSPGNSGDITQSTQILSNAVAANAAAIAQTAAQVRALALPPRGPPGAEPPPAEAPAGAVAEPPPVAAAAPAGSAALIATTGGAPAGNETIGLAATEAPVDEIDPLPLRGAPRFAILSAGPRLATQGRVMPRTGFRRTVALPAGAVLSEARVEKSRLEPAPQRAPRRPRRPRRDGPERPPAAPPLSLPTFPTLTQAGSAHGTGGASVGLGIVAAAAAAAALDLLRRVVPSPVRLRGQHSGERPDPPG